MTSNKSSANLSCAAASGYPFDTQLYDERCTYTSVAAESPNRSNVTTPYVNIWRHLPLAFCTGDNHENIHIVDEDTFDFFLQTEFSLKRIHDVESALWAVGSPKPARSLITQTQLGRTIVLTDSLDMHLLWAGSKIYIKPLPRYLLEHKIRETAHWFLYSYACLITSQADLELAIELKLIPKAADQPPDWETWRKLGAELLRSGGSGWTRERFIRSELRLDRLNWIYILRGLRDLDVQMYYNPWANYEEFLTSNISLITTTTVYIVIVLTAMQVGLGTSVLKDNAAFNKASYGFTIFAILGPFGALFLLLLVLFVIVIQNCRKARKSRKSRKSATATTRNTPSSKV
ncbi:hypothetical protein GGS21DRAFT_541075 [Xylaria nigripes]|nr:hypothetical protein GGS21DRAFT_541075 [Xylaria nigripes]